MQKLLLNFSYLFLFSIILGNALLLGVPAKNEKLKLSLVRAMSTHGFPEEEKPSITTSAIVNSEMTVPGRSFTKSRPAVAPTPEKKIIEGLRNDQVLPGFETFPVALPMTEAPSQERDVIVNEENTTGKKITKAYRVKLKDGKWSTETLWIVAENNSPKLSQDSLPVKTDSLHRLIPEFQ